MADIAAIREAIANALNTLPDVRAHAHRPDTIQTPALIVEPVEVDFKHALGRGELWTFNVVALLGSVSNTAAQKLRDEYFGGIRDVYDVIEGHGPLNDGTVADDASVPRAESFDTLTVAGIDYVGVLIFVQVIT